MFKIATIAIVLVAIVLGYLWYSDVISFNSENIPSAIEDVPGNIKNITQKIPQLDTLPVIEVPEQITTTLQDTTESFKPDFDTQRINQLIYNYTNEQRMIHGQQSLSYDVQLANVALVHSTDMSERTFFAHNTPEGKTPTDRANENNYSCIKHFDTKYREGIGENLALHWLYTSYSVPNVYSSYTWHTEDSLAKKIVDGWMASPGHRQNILDPTYDKIGIAVAVNGTDAVYSTQNFC